MLRRAEHNGVRVTLDTETGLYGLYVADGEGMQREWVPWAEDATAEIVQTSLEAGWLGGTKRQARNLVRKLLAKLETGKVSTVRRNPASLNAGMWQGLGIENDYRYFVLFLDRTRLLIRAEAYDATHTQLWFQFGDAKYNDPRYAKTVVVPNVFPLPWVKSRPPSKRPRRARRNPLAPPPPSPPRRNPGVSQTTVEAYERFHGVTPGKVESVQGWVPGELVDVGVGVDVGYKVRDSRSTKGAQQPYVHDFGSGVTIYRRAKRGESPNKTWHNFPTELMVLGSNIGFTYRDKNGKLKEVKGSTGKRLAVTPDRRTLAVVGRGGIEYVLRGGAMHVSDWIHN